MSSASTGGTEGSSPASSPASAASQAMSAPKYGTLVPNRIFVGGISASTSEAELAQLFSSYGNVKATKIISDRAGVSKGYGFVTFETEEEAKRLQQESECIILKERKLNIAPAIKKQPFNRSFDGGTGSPPAVPTSPYYYTNGMGLPYQNGITFYNTGAPAPGTPLAQPTDPTAIYQAAGVFGPQAGSAHQTYTPMMYPCPAPSLAYMPQQYQYSPMPYESYYTGAAGAPQYLYATSTPTSNGSGGGGVGGGGGSSAGGGNGATGATSPTATVPHGLQSLPPAPTHYYTTSGPPTGAPTHHHQHHHPLPSGPGTPQLDHAYYSFTAAGPPHPTPLHSHPQQPPPPPPQQQHGGHIGLGDQQLLLFTTDATCQQSANNSDSQTISQEDTRSASSQSEHQSQLQSGSNNETTHVSIPSTPLIPIMPIKYPNRYTNYHPLTVHPSSISQNSPMGPTTATTPGTQDMNANSMHCRTFFYQPVFLPNLYNATGASLLPTPLGAFDSPKIRDCINHTNKSYSHGRNQNGYNSFSTVHQTALNKSTTKFTPTRASNNSHNRRNNSNPHIFYVTRSSNSSLSYKSPNQFVSARHNGDVFTSQSSSLSSNIRRNLNSDFSIKRNNNSHLNHSKSNLHDSNHNNDVTCKSEAGNSADNNKPLSPPPAPYSPMTHPLPNLSPPNPQVQFYTAQSRYQSQSQQNHHHHHQQQQQQQSSQYQQQQPQQQQQQQQRRYGSTISNQIGSSGRKSADKFNSSTGGQGVILRNNKFKVNGMMPNTGKNVEEGLGGAGDAQQTVGRMPLTPPGTPRNLQESNQMNDTCHQMQALTL